MLLREQLAQIIRDAIAAAQAAGALPLFEVPAVEISRPKDPTHGDYATSIAMQSAKVAKRAPLQIAQAIVEHVPQGGVAATLEAVPPGFINIRLNERWVAEQVAAIEAATGEYGNLDMGAGRRYQVEFISANPTGPLHIGSARNAVLGDTYANLLGAAGYDVQREYYVNDAGTQMRTFAETLFLRYLQVLVGDSATLEDYHYKGLYMRNAAERVVDQYGERWLSDVARQFGAEALPRPWSSAPAEVEAAVTELGKIGLEMMLESIRRSVGLLRIRFDCWFSEQSLYEDGTWERVLAQLSEAGLTEFRDGATWLKTSTLGSDRDEVLVRSDGRPGYYASDVAYHYNKFVLRGFDRVLDVWAVDHQNQARRMPFLMKALGLDPARLTIMLYDLVRLYRDGQEVKLSKRSGDIITVDEVVDEVGADAIRYTLLTRANESVMDFDLNLAVKDSKENPVYYVQYAHARMSSILQKAGERGFEPGSWSGGNLELLRHPLELALLRKMLELSEVIEKAIMQMAPHHVAFYALELARAYHTFNDHPECRVIMTGPAERELSLARLRLVAATRTVFARVLALMGMAAPESM